MKKMFAIIAVLVLTVALMVPVAAAPSDFVPSIEAKPGPSIVPMPGEGGVPSYGVIVMPDGSQIPLPEGSIVITPIGGKNDADEDVKDALEDALKDLDENLKDILEQLFPGTDMDNIVITDIFHVEISGDVSDFLDEGGKIKVTVSPSSEVIVALQKNPDAWSALLGENFIDNGDGTYTLILDKSTIIALGKDVLDVDVDPENPGVSSPTTGEEPVVAAVAVETVSVETATVNWSVVLLISGTVLAVAALTFVVFACKKRA